jgi:lysophospholipase L1-like esterase
VRVGGFTEAGKVFLAGRGVAMSYRRRLACAGSVLLLAALGLPAAASQANAQTPDGHAPSTARKGAAVAVRPHAVVQPGDESITFSDQPEGTAIDKQYQAHGIVFSGANGGGTPFISPDAANPTSPVLSGSPQFHGGIKGQFVRPGTGKQRTVSRFSLDVGYIDDPGSVAVTAFGTDGTQLAQSVVNQTGIVPVTLKATGMASFQVDEVAGEDAGFAIDNVSYPITRDLAALGDSYSSGEANPPYDAGTGSATGCHRSSKAWARMIATDSPKVHLTRHIACSGATTDALSHSFKGEKPQLTQLKSLKEEPGYITMTMGGNDAGFAKVLTDCFTPFSDCVKHGTITQAAKDIDHLGTTLPAQYRTIQKTWPNADVVIVGYPRLLPVKSHSFLRCPTLGNKERQGLNDLATRFDTMLAKATAEAGVHYVSVLNTLNGHELCTSSSWIHSLLNGGQERGHPTAKGQQAIEAPVLKRINTL